MKIGKEPVKDQFRKFNIGIIGAQIELKKVEEKKAQYR